MEIKNRFIASAAHDLRQPVHALDLYAGWLAAEPEFVEQITPKIVRSTKAVTSCSTPCSTWPGWKPTRCARSTCRRWTWRG